MQIELFKEMLMSNETEALMENYSNKTE